MSSLTPVCRDSMRLLKAQKDEEKRVAEEAARTARVNQIISEIYKNAVRTAETTTETSYKYDILMRNGLNNVNESREMIIYTTRMPDILAGLQQLFPDCSVAHKLLVIGQDGKMHDISTMNVDIIPFIQVRRKQECIVVDWS
jgi:uncharacterized HAD superfamily protein